ncbi:4-coumarate--CoA ligase, partial [Paucibacter sp. XJ19-41]|nr:4-coumarate--CoA ligase [Paucibacter sp. XJ19-41]
MADDQDFQRIADLIHQHALQRPAAPALRQGDTVLSYAALDALMDRIACALQREGVAPGQAIALCGL